MKADTLKMTKLVLALSLLFVMVAVPFKTMTLIPGFTEIRPVDCFNTVYGMLFGIYGAIACTLGNFIADALGGTLTISSWAGALANFLGTYVAYLSWYRLSKETPTMKDLKQISIFIIVSIITAIVIGGIVAFGVWLHFREMNPNALFWQIFYNTVGFSIVLGIPLLIVSTMTYHVNCMMPKKLEKREDTNAL